MRGNGMALLSSKQVEITGKKMIQNKFHTQD